MFGRFFISGIIAATTSIFIPKMIAIVPLEPASSGTERAIFCLVINCLLDYQNFDLIHTVKLDNVLLETNFKYSPRMMAFLATIRWAETGTSGAESYKKLTFRGTFNNFSTHPLKKQCALVNGRQICSTAAGAYQMLDKSWYELAPKLNLKDFSPASQDKMAVEYIRRNKAISDVEAGNFEYAASKVGRIWASFPDNDYNQNPKSMNKLMNYYQQQLLAFGGQ